MTAALLMSPSQMFRHITAGHGPIRLTLGQTAHPVYLPGPSGAELGCLVAATARERYRQEWETRLVSLWRLNVFTGAAHQVDPGAGCRIAVPAALAFPAVRPEPEEVLDAQAMAAVLLDELHPVVFTEAGRTVAVDYWHWFAAGQPAGVRELCWRQAPDFFTWLLDSAKEQAC